MHGRFGLQFKDGGIACLWFAYGNFGARISQEAVMYQAAMPLLGYT